MKAKSSSNTESILSTPGFRDCWPFLTAWHVTWDTNSFVEERFPFEKPDGEDLPE
jgi:hypothetical protein